MSVSFSIIIPVYNGEKYIDECLSSILSQIGNADEILVHDDGSTDSTRQILATYQSRINLSFDKNHGVSFSRNHLAKRAKGSYLLFVDADDLLAPNALSILRQELFEKQVDCALTPILFFNQTKENRSHIYFEGAIEVEADPLRFFLQRIPPAASLVVSNEFFQKTKGFCRRIRHSEELDLVLHLCEHRAKWIFIQDVVRYNRIHGSGQASNNLKLCNWRSVVILHSVHLKRFRLSLDKNQSLCLYDSVRTSGRILFRIGEYKLARIALAFADRLSRENSQKESSLFNNIAFCIGHYRSECFRKFLNKFLGRNEWGQDFT
jgi:glycosyltransferase involved in cell wall biosynthesis